MDTEFSCNRHATPTDQFQVPTRHPELCFEDGNLAVITGSRYFLVHLGLLRRHCVLLKKRLPCLSCITKNSGERMIEGRPVLALDDDANDFAHFLRALYGLSYDNSADDFPVVSAVLRLATKYEVLPLRENTVRKVSLSWPSTLRLWEIREKRATSADAMCPPHPHPLLAIKLAREIDVPQFLPSAFYDLSRRHPSQLMEGHVDAEGVHHHLSDDDLCKVLRGKEHGARFFSTFIVTELEGRGSSVNCLHRNEVQPALKRACQMAFEAVTYELIRDMNGIVYNRNSDPLFSIADSVLMQTRDDQPGVENRAAYRACEACRLEYAAVVQAAREAFWRQLPTWFELDVKNWA